MRDSTRPTGLNSPGAEHQEVRTRMLEFLEEPYLDAFIGCVESKASGDMSLFEKSYRCFRRLSTLDPVGMMATGAVIATGGLLVAGSSGSHKTRKSCDPSGTTVNSSTPPTSS